ncbi:MAG: hypothetical protein ABSD68_04250 [Candidatus Micrarchaeales archaeon]|jgi:hypothetical protein
MVDIENFGSEPVKVKKMTEFQGIKQLRTALLENANYIRTWSEIPKPSKSVESVLSERAKMCIRMGLDFGEVSDKLDKMIPSELAEVLNKINSIDMRAREEKEKLREWLFPQEMALHKKLLSEQKR